MSKTPIQWTEQTWNPVRGCSPVSPGCKHCYAERQGGRFAGPGRPFDGFIQIGKNGNPGPHWTGKVELIPEMLDVPLRRRKPTTYFVNSMSDLFHDRLSQTQIDRALGVIEDCPQHTFQVLTKRAGRMLDHMGGYCARKFPPANLWLGVSVENQQYADERIPLLLQTPAAVRFISAEPLLGPVDLRTDRNYLDGEEEPGTPFDGAPHVGGCVGYTPPLDWVIVGGESGPGARPFDIAWARSIVRQCKDAGVPCFVKQLGANAWVDRDRWHNDQTVKAVDLKGGPNVRLALKDKKGGNTAEWPAGLRVRETPERISR